MSAEQKTWWEYIEVSTADQLYERAVALQLSPGTTWTEADQNFMRVLSPVWLAAWAIVRMERFALRDIINGR